MLKQSLVGDHGVDRHVEGVGDRKVVEFSHNAVEDALGQAVASLERQVDIGNRFYSCPWLAIRRVWLARLPDGG